MRHESVTKRDLVSLGKGVSPILAVVAAAMPASAMSAAATSTESAILTFATIPSEAAILTGPAMLVEPCMPMRKAVAPATMIPVIALVESVSVVAVANGPVANGPVANGLRHARGQGKTDADQQRYGPRQYSAVIHCRLRFL